MRRLNPAQRPRLRQHPADPPEVGERSMLRLIAATAPEQLASFTATLDEAITRWMCAAQTETLAGLEQELSRVHALKSVTSALGSSRIADACEALSDSLRTGQAAGTVRQRGCALAMSAQRLLRRTTAQSLIERR